MHKTIHKRPFMREDALYVYVSLLYPEHCCVTSIQFLLWCNEASYFVRFCNSVWWMCQSFCFLSFFLFFYYHQCCSWFWLSDVSVIFFYLFIYFHYPQCSSSWLWLSLLLGLLLSLLLLLLVMLLLLLFYHYYYDWCECCRFIILIILL